MTDRLFLRFAIASPQITRWVVLDSLGNIVMPEQEGSLADIASAQEQRDVIVIIPGIYVRQLQTYVPSSNWRQVQQAIPYAIEEQLATDLSAVHFAVQRHGNQAQQTVYVIEQSLLNSIIESCQASGIKITHICADYQLINAKAEPCSIYLLDDHAIARWDDNHAFSIEIEQLADYVELLAAEQPGVCTIYGAPPLPALDNLPHHAHPLPQPVFTTLCQQFTPTIANLYDAGSAKRRTQPGSRASRIAGASVLVALAVYTSALLLQYSTLQRNTQLGQATIENLYRQVFPDAQQVVSPRIRLNRELANLQQGQQPLQRSIALLSNYVASNAGVTVTQLNYQQNGLNISWQAPKLAALDGVITQLQAEGLTITRQDTRTTPQLVSMQLRITWGT